MPQEINLEDLQRRIAVQQAESVQTSSVREQSARLVETVWQWMSSMFGHRWTSSFGDAIDPDRVWSAALAGLDEQQVRAGMRAVMDAGDEWPPSAPEFRRLCQGRSDAWEHQTAAYRQFDAPRLVDLTAKDRAEQAGREALASLRASFGISK